MGGYLRIPVTVVNVIITCCRLLAIFIHPESSCRRLAQIADVNVWHNILSCYGGDPRRGGKSPSDWRISFEVPSTTAQAH